MLYVNPLEVSRGARTSQILEGASREKTALKEYEHYFLYTLLREMRNTVTKNDLFGDSQSRQVYEDMLDDYMAGEMAKSGQFGIARQIEAQLRVNESRTGKAASPENLEALPLQIQQAGIALRTKTNSRPAGILPINQAATPATTGI